MKEKDTKKLSLWRICRRVLPMVIAACPGYYLATQLLSTVHGMSWGVETWARQGLFDAVTEAIGGIVGTSPVVIAAAVLSLVVIGAQILNGVCNFMISAAFQRIGGHMQGVVQDKAARVDPIAFEDPAHLDAINKASEGASNCAMLAFGILSVFTFYIPYFLFMSVYLYTLKPLLVVTIVVVFVPNLLTNLLRGLVFAKLEDRAAPLRRQSDYYEEAMCDRAFFKETRALGAVGFFRGLYQNVLALLNRETWAAERRVALAEIGVKLTAILGYGVVLWLLLDAVGKGEISVGALAAVLSSIGMLYGIMEEIVCRHLGEVTRNMSTVRNFIAFLDLPERGGAQETPDAGMGIVAEGVTFRYPGAERDCLRGASLRVAPGETVAIVGENGAGKSTLVRLLTGLYLPQAGRVTIGGCDTARVAPAALWRGISGVFQKYQRYQMTLRENVHVSDMDAALDEAAALAGAGVAADAEAFPQGMETMLSREFDGVDLSGGQWQRVAIARGLYRAHGMIVLDEPTAAIDPVEETHVYERFAELARDATALIVTHRLGSARIADRIVVMADGQVVEEGSHDALVGQGGAYARMWEAQAQWYT